MACSVLKKKNQFRNVKVTLPPEIRQIYMDDDGNFVFNGYFLDEYKQEDEESDETMTELMKKFVATSQHNKNDLGSVTRSFVLEKFKGKSQNAKFWLMDFESECIRHEISSDEKKIEALRLFLEDAGKDWFAAVQMKSSLTETWATWKQSFLETFADKGWSNVRMAFNFKFLGGSLLEYALKKEKLLLESDKEMPTKTRIYLIVLGLPIQVQDRLDKEEIITTEILMGFLRKLESLVNKSSQKNTENKNTNLNFRRDSRINVSEKKPCSICDNLGKPGRYHPIELCRNKSKHNEIKSINNLEMEEKLNFEFSDTKN